MKRREFLSMAAATGAALSMPRAFSASVPTSGVVPQPDACATAARRRGNLLILIELKGGNDGLNTVVPFADPAYYALRRHIAIPRDRVIALDERMALHPSLHPLLPLWRGGQLAVVQGVGCVQANASHFRSMEIWDTGSRGDVYRRDGWLARAFSQWRVPPVRALAAAFGSVEAGPFAGLSFTHASRDCWAHVLNRDDAPRFNRSNVNLAEDDRVRHDAFVDAPIALPSRPATFPDSIDAALRAALVSTQPGSCGAIRVTLDGFDTHANQPERHAALLEQLAQGCATLHAELALRGSWNDTLIITYSEFGRSARENMARGTEHGGAAAHFVMGGRVTGGLYGRPPDLARLDATGQLPVDIDFRRLYATVLGPFWGLDARGILKDDVKPLPLLRA
ncbi:DUF1501 domain-containing protein [Paraburkholderia diazotrophica]|uniref:Uncharacterized conserved protein, DUF1501 family n=1 Tax=Paraburkholderia diazotrophica TaxID=667676 RepID=A0A1H6R0A0_9BURK|nr:DUF1501 domain-containing protein [Paraburkholderia diazotrophica]SEI45160.1 Uncharacterized conserved protein, DUF1501 family [Paraburkholderia diazotrophica]